MRWPSRLEDMPIGQRIAVTFVVVFLALIFLALWGLLTGGWDQADSAPRAPSRVQDRAS